MRRGRARSITGSIARSLALVALAALAALFAGHDAIAADGDARRNWFDDPFVQATAALAACPVPEGPLSTEAERRADAHWRVERGTSCFRSGRCRLQNSYLYDREIVPRVRQFILGAGRFDDTSVWITGQRRWVRLQGCVRSRAEAAELVDAVRGIDDVEAVVDELMVGTQGKPPYRVRVP